MKSILHPQDWGLGVNPKGELLIGNFRAVDLAREYGTPLHVLNEPRLESTARRFLEAVRSSYPGRASVHFAFKCNSVPAVLETVRRAGLKAEVMSEFELQLALHLGYEAKEIVVNGPGKTDRFLGKCLEEDVGLIVVDSLDELSSLSRLCQTLEKGARILLRINPDYVPRRMNQGSATGSRKGCAFGLDLKGGEVALALQAASEMKNIRFQGYHFHIGTGIRDPRDYGKALGCLPLLIGQANSFGWPVACVDIGGGFASETTREFTTREFLLYQGFERLPEGCRRTSGSTFNDFASEISWTILKCFSPKELPELLFEPGRCIASPNQLLLLTVHRVKERPGLKKWLVTDGGLGTVTLPTFYEYHEIFLANDVFRSRTEKVTIIGPVCFASDIVYRNKRMPRIVPGEVIAVMDSGAYFTALESSFGFARPAMVAVTGRGHRLVRRAETFEDLVSRDVLNHFKEKEVSHEIYGH